MDADDVSPPSEEKVHMRPQIGSWALGFSGLKSLDLMKPISSMPHSHELSNNPILSKMNPIPRINTYLFNIHSNIALSSTPRPP